MKCVKQFLLNITSDMRICATYMATLVKFRDQFSWKWTTTNKIWTMSQFIIVPALFLGKCRHQLSILQRKHDVEASRQVKNKASHQQRKRHRMTTSKEIMVLCGYNTYMSNVWNRERRVQASTQKPWWINRCTQVRIGHPQASISVVPKGTYPQNLKNKYLMP